MIGSPIWAKNRSISQREKVEGTFRGNEWKVWGGVYATFRVKFSLGQNSNLVFASALGVYEALQTAFESYQGGQQFSYRGLFDDTIFGRHSSFSEEDLTSDLLGFYQAVMIKRGRSPEEALDEVKRLCKVVGLEYGKGSTKFFEAQKDIFQRYTRGHSVYDMRGPGGFLDMHQWGKPRLADIDTGFCPTYCSDSVRQFPPEFQEFIPIAGGTWEWKSGHAEWHVSFGKRHYDPYHEFTVSELNQYR